MQIYNKDEGFLNPLAFRLSCGNITDAESHLFMESLQED